MKPCLACLALLFVVTHAPGLAAQENQNTQDSPPAASQETLQLLQPVREIPGSLESRLARLEAQARAARRRLDGLDSRMDRFDQDLKRVADVAEANATGISQLQQLIEKNAQQIDGLTQTVQRNSQQFDSLAATVHDNTSKLEQTVTRDGQGGYMPDLFGNMQKPAFREEMERQTEGVIRVYNPGPYPHQVAINGTSWRAPVGWSQMPIRRGRTPVTHISNGQPTWLNDWQWDDRDHVWVLRYQIPSQTFDYVQQIETFRFP